MDVLKLIQDRCSLDFAASVAAQQRLRESGVDVLPDLLAILARADFPSLQYNWEVVNALAEIGAAAVPGALAILTLPASDGVCWAAAESLGYIGAPSVPALIEALGHADPMVQQAAAYALTACADARALDALHRALDSSDPLVRLSAIKTLRHRKLTNGAPKLRLTLNGTLSTAEPRAAYRWALKNLTYAETDSEVLSLLDDVHVPGDVGANALHGLRQVWQDDSVRLLDVLYTGRYTMRARAADALGLFGDAAAVPDLLAALQDDDDSVRGHAARALGQIGDRRALPLLLALLDDADIWLQWAAAQALGALGDPAAVRPLLNVWAEAEHEALVAVTLDALERIGEAGIGELTAALRDPQSSIAEGAAFMLERIGTPEALAARNSYMP